MSVKLMSLVWESEFPTPVAKLIALKLADHANDEGHNVYPGKSSLERQTGCSNGAVKQWLRTFDRIGLVTVVGVHGCGPNGRVKTALRQFDVGRLTALAFGTQRFHQVDGDWVLMRIEGAFRGAAVAPGQQMPRGIEATEPGQRLPDAGASHAPKPSLNRQKTPTRGSGHSVDQLLADLESSSADEIIIDHFLRSVLDVRDLKAPNPTSALRDVLTRGHGLSRDQLTAAAHAVLRDRTHNVGHSDLTRALDAVRGSGAGQNTASLGVDIRPETHPSEWEAWQAYASEHRRTDALAHRIFSTMPHGFAKVPALIPPKQGRAA